MKKSLISLILILSVVSNGRATATLMNGYVPDKVSNFFAELVKNPQAMVDMYNTFQVNGKRDIGIVAIPRAMKDNTQPDDDQILQLCGTIHLVTAIDDGAGAHTFARFTAFPAPSANAIDAVTNDHFPGDGQAGEIIPGLLAGVGAAALDVTYSALINQAMLDALKDMRGGDRLVATDLLLLLRIRLGQALALCEGTGATVAGVGQDLIPYVDAAAATDGGGVAVGGGHVALGHIVANVAFVPGTITLNHGQQIAQAVDGVLGGGVVKPTLANLRNYMQYVSIDRDIS